MIFRSKESWSRKDALLSRLDAARDRWLHHPLLMNTHEWRRGYGQYPSEERLRLIKPFWAAKNPLH
jgi:hypothetical protein